MITITVVITKVFDCPKIARVSHLKNVLAKWKISRNGECSLQSELSTNFYLTVDEI